MKYLKIILNDIRSLFGLEVILRILYLITSYFVGVFIFDPRPGFDAFIAVVAGGAIVALFLIVAYSLLEYVVSVVDRAKRKE